jgi:signal transduction histidine kinase
MILPSFEYRHDVVWYGAFVGLIALIAGVRIARKRAGAVNEQLERVNLELETALKEANRARRIAQDQTDRLRLLDEASSLLASSLDYEKTIAAAARLAVPRFAEWCSVDIIVGKEIRQVASSHIDTPGFQRMSEVRARYPLSADAATGLANVIRTGATVFAPNADEAFVAKQARSPEHLEVSRSLGINSAMIVPMIARGHTIGALTVVRARAGQPFDEGSVTLARDIARRAAIAIDNAQLYRNAVEANESKAIFLATMSHELRTPLTAIIGYDDLLAEGIVGEVNDAQREHLARIKVSAQQLLSLIEDILLHARIEAGRESVRLAEVRAKDIVEDSITVVAPLAQSRGLSLTAEAVSPELSLRTDGGKVRQMLINLIANAVKFTERGSITVRAFERDGGVVFEVEDTGIGIAPENLERIFEAFWQVEQHKTRTAGGSGLGLSTTRKLAKALGGDATVESRQGAGSTFRITLPCVLREPPMEDLVSSSVGRLGVE